MNTDQIIARLQQVDRREEQQEWRGNITQADLNKLFKLELVEWVGGSVEYYELTTLGQLVLQGYRRVMED